MKAYLAGAIEHAPDFGKRWRENISKFLRNELKHSFYNPLIEELKYLSDEEREKFRALKFQDIGRYKEIVRKLITGDLTNIESNIDYIICLWDEFSEKGGGTYGELTLAFHLKIPVYMVTRKKITEISGWILGCTTEIFPDFEKLKKYLQRKYQ